MTSLNAPYFHDDDKARRHLEAVRWPNSPVCPHCGVVGGHYALKGKAHRPGLYKCKDCRKQFSVTVGTVFERSKIPLSKWLMAAYLICSSKKGISVHQLHRTLGVTYKTAWFLAHRIRHAVEAPQGGLMGSSGQIVEADETFIGRKKGHKVRAAWGHKNAVFSLVERGGEVRSVHLSGKQFAEHMTVKHKDDEYVRGDAHTNTLEGYFSVFKRGMKGVYQHCGSQHLHRYLVEFDFRYNHRASLGVEDGQRVIDALRGIEGKRLTYRSAS